MIARLYLSRINSRIYLTLLIFIQLLLFSTLSHANKQIESLQKEAIYKPCQTVVKHKKIKSDVEKVILTASLLTDSKAILELMQSEPGELSHFIQYAISFCNIIPSYSFKEITDRLL